MITCHDCKGNGFTIFLGRESSCKPCGGSGKMVVCDQYSLAPNAVVAFRNQPCWNCGVRENDHVVEVNHVEAS